MIPSTTYREISCARNSTAEMFGSSNRGNTDRLSMLTRYPALANSSTVAFCKLPLGIPIRNVDSGNFVMTLARNLLRPATHAFTAHCPLRRLLPHLLLPLRPFGGRLPRHREELVHLFGLELVLH